MLRACSVRKVKLGLLTTFAVAGGTVFSSCVTDMRDSIVAGSLSALEATANNWISGLLIDFNELFDPLFDFPIWTP